MGGISSFFDLAEGALDAFDASGIGGRSARRAAAPAADPDPRAAVPRAATRGTVVSGESALTRQRFRVVESIDAQTGATQWVVTDGVERAECSSATLAERVRVALG